MFPIWILQTLIYGSLIFTTIGVLVLLAMLYKDNKNKTLW